MTKGFFVKLEEDMRFWYNWYYNNDNDPRIHEEVECWAEEFDRALKEDGDFKEAVCDFAKKRQDIIVSDREAAAFIRAYDFTM